VEENGRDKGQADTGEIWRGLSVGVADDEGGFPEHKPEIGKVLRRET
jgi:hypothetical protein